MSNCNTAILLSAGMARRLYPLTTEKPKNLIKIHGTKTILDYQLEALDRSGVIEKVYIVVGFQHKKVKEYIKPNIYSFSIDFILNPFFEVSNNIVSVWLALKEIKGPLITINGDDVFSENIIKRIANTQEEVVLSISKSSVNYDDDDMKVILSENNDRLLEIGKHLDVKETQAESIGIIKYTKKGTELFLEAYDCLLEDDHANIGIFYLSVIQKMISIGNEISVLEFGENEWREFDFPEDIELFKNDLTDSILEGEVFQEN